MRAYARLDPEVKFPSESLSADGSVNVTGPFIQQQVMDGDYREVIIEAVRALLDKDKRVADGHFFSITIVA